MKMLIHRTPIEGIPQPFDLAFLKDRARIDHNDEDFSLLALGSTAASEIEQVAQIALLDQTIRVTVFNPVMEAFLHLPIGPAHQTDAVTVTLDGDPFTDFEFIPGHRPAIRWKVTYYDKSWSRLQVEYRAGFGATADSIPMDLQLAIADQAALIYDIRGATDGKSLTSSPHMARVAARYRGVRA